jgi:hypothetical protein
LDTVTDTRFPTTGVYPTIGDFNPASDWRNCTYQIERLGRHAGIAMKIALPGFGTSMDEVSILENFALDGTLGGGPECRTCRSLRCVHIEMYLREGLDALVLFSKLGADQIIGEVSPTYNSAIDLVIPEFMTGNPIGEFRMTLRTRPQGLEWVHVGRRSTFFGPGDSRRTMVHEATIALMSMSADQVADLKCRAAQHDPAWPAEDDVVNRFALFFNGRCARCQQLAAEVDKYIPID